MENTLSCTFNLKVYLVCGHCIVSSTKTSRKYSQIQNHVCGRISSIDRGTHAASGGQGWTARGAVWGLPACRPLPPSPSTSVDGLAHHPLAILSLLFRAQLYLAPLFLPTITAPSCGLPFHSAGGRSQPSSTPPHWGPCYCPHLHWLAPVTLAEGRLPWSLKRLPPTALAAHGRCCPEPAFTSLCCSAGSELACALR